MHFDFRLSVPRPKHAVKAVKRAAGRLARWIVTLMYPRGKRNIQNSVLQHWRRGGGEQHSLFLVAFFLCLHVCNLNLYVFTRPYCDCFLLCCNCVHRIERRGRQPVKSAAIHQTECCSRCGGGDTKLLLSIISRRHKLYIYVDSRDDVTHPKGWFRTGWIAELAWNVAGYLWWPDMPHSWKLAIVALHTGFVLSLLVALLEQALLRILLGQ